jgi:hypothetical protein
MTFKKGWSGGPGRPKGSRNKRSIIAEEFEKAGSAVAQVVAAKAQAGDMRAAEILLSRVEPTLKSTSQRVQIDLDMDASFDDQCKSVINAATRGELDLDAAQTLLNMLAARVGFQNIDQFLEELKKMRLNPPIRGGVKTEPPKD